MGMDGDYPEVDEWFQQGNKQITIVFLEGAQEEEQWSLKSHLVIT